MPTSWLFYLDGPTKDKNAYEANMHARCFCFLTLLSLCLSASDVGNYALGQVTDYFDDDQINPSKPLSPKKIPAETYFLFFSADEKNEEVSKYNSIVFLSEKILRLYFLQKSKGDQSIDLSSLKKAFKPYLTAVILAARFYSKGMATLELWNKINEKATHHHFIRKIRDSLNSYNKPIKKIINRAEIEFLVTIAPRFNFPLEQELLRPNKIPKIFYYLFYKTGTMRNTEDVELFNATVYHSEKILDIYFENTEKQNPEHKNKIQRDAVPYLMAVLTSVKFCDDSLVWNIDLWSGIVRLRDHEAIARLFDSLIERFSAEIDEETLTEVEAELIAESDLKTLRILKNNSLSELSNEQLSDLRDNVSGIYNKIYDKKAAKKISKLFSKMEMNFLRTIKWRLFFDDPNTNQS